MQNVSWHLKWRLFCRPLISTQVFSSNRRITHSCAKQIVLLARVRLLKMSAYYRSPECWLFRGQMRAEKVLRWRLLAYCNSCCKLACWCLLHLIVRCVFSSKFIQTLEIINLLKMNWVHTLTACNAWSSFWAEQMPKHSCCSMNLERVRILN